MVEDQVAKGNIKKSKNLKKMVVPQGRMGKYYVYFYGLQSFNRCTTLQANSLEIRES